MPIGVEVETYPTAIVPGLAQWTGVPSLALRAFMGVTLSRSRRRDGGDGAKNPRRLRSGLLWVSRSAGADAGTAVTFIEALDASRGTPRRSGSRSPCQSAWKRKPTQRQSFPVSPNGPESRRWRSGLVLGVTARQGPRLREPPGSDPGCLRRLPSGAARLPEADREPCRRHPRPPRCRTGFLDSRSG
jgi:hypothetical protein